MNSGGIHFSDTLFHRLQSSQAEVVGGVLKLKIEKAQHGNDSWLFFRKKYAVTLMWNCQTAVITSFRVAHETGRSNKELI